MSDFQYRAPVKDDPDRPTCYNRALDLLSRRAHFSSELRRKLRQRHYEEDEIEAAVAKLFERKFLDDRATAKAFVEAKLRRGGLGRQKLLADLLKRGVDGDLATEAVAGLGYEEELAAGREAESKWRRQSARASASGSNKQVLARHLNRKGFSKRVILAILADAPEALEDV
jgi:regulatory protein